MTVFMFELSARLPAIPHEAVGAMDVVEGDAGYVKNRSSVSMTADSDKVFCHRGHRDQRGEGAKDFSPLPEWEKDA